MSAAMCSSTTLTIMNLIGIGEHIIHENLPVLANVAAIGISIKISNISTSLGTRDWRSNRIAQATGCR
jgi:hypothetical protein